MIDELSEPLPRWRRIVLAVLCVGLTIGFLAIVNAHYKIVDWLFWHYARVWIWSLALVLGSLGTGELVVRRLVGRIRGLHAHLFVSFCTGLLAFGLVVFVAGMLQLYSTWLFYVLPLANLALGGRNLWAMRRELWPRVQRHAPMRLAGPLAIVVFVFGMYAFLMIYAGVLVPGNVSFDSQWMHTAIAESFVGAGGIFRYPEGYMVAARPLFASYLYTWAFMLPDSELFDRVVLCAHIEFVVFAMTTLLGIPALVRRLVPRANPMTVWAARFLFPGVFLYDSSLSIGADHIAAVWVIPIFLCTHDFVRRGMGVRWGVMLALMTGGVVLSKETAAVMTIPMAAVVILVAVAGAVRKAKRLRGPFFARHRWILGLLAIVIAGLTVTSPLWLKNLVWYGDPLYPTTHSYFSPRPWAPDADYMFEHGYMEYQKTYLEHDDDESEEINAIKSDNPIAVLYNWSFDPHDWGQFHGSRPVIGSLLTLLLPCLLFLRGTKRLWLLAGWIHLGIALWYQLMPQDRYLQTLMPWMASFTAGVLVLMWRARVRVFVALLVGAQIVWGGDVYFLSRNQLPAVVKLFEASRSKEKDKFETRLATQGDYEKIGKWLPEGSRLLMHEIHPHLGVRVPSHHDFQTWQFGLSYGLMTSPREVWQAFRDMGITHVWWRPQKSRGWDSVAGEIMFFDFAMRYTLNPEKFGKAIVAEMPEEPPPDEAHFEDTVVVLGCGEGKGFLSGLYRVRDLHVSPFGPDAHTFPAPRVPAKSRKQVLALAPSASYAVLDPGCSKGAEKELPKGFVLAVDRPKVPRVNNRAYKIYIRMEGRAAPWPNEPE